MRRASTWCGHVRDCVSVAVQEHPPLVCGQLREQALSLRKSLSKSAASTGSNYDLARQHHKWDIFGTEPDISHLVRHLVVVVVVDMKCKHRVMPVCNATA